MKLPIGSQIQFVAVSEKGRNSHCIAEVIGSGDMGPMVKVIFPPRRFQQPPVFTMAARSIVKTPSGYEYTGEVGGAVLIPEFLWTAEFDAYFSDALKPVSRAVCPLFRRRYTSVEQFATGVLVRIGEQAVILTAAHALDGVEHADLLIPGRDSLIVAVGSYATSRVPSSGERKDDVFDTAYIRLDTSVAENLHPDFSLLESEDCDAFDTPMKGSFYTAVGFPAKKSVVSSGTAGAELQTLTGMAVEESVYESVGRNNREHVVFRYRRLKGVDWLTQRRQIVGVPEGMSGGAVFAWTKAFPTSDVIEPPKLVGILTEVADGRGLLIATKLGLFLQFILRNNPDLPIHLV